MNAYDIGIQKKEGFYIGGHLKFCQYIKETQSFVFLQKKKDYDRIILIRDGGKKEVPLDKSHLHIIDYRIANDMRFYLTKDHIYEEKTQSYIDISNYNPISFNCLQSSIVITTQDNILLVLDINTLSISRITLRFPFSEAYHLHDFDEKSFFVTDSKRHIVALVDYQGRILWLFGKKDDPGEEPGKLSVPIRTELCGKNLIAISEQRNHRVSVVDINTRDVFILGKTSWVGDTDNYLWAPIFVTMDQNKYAIVMCKGGSISIRTSEGDIYNWSLFLGGMPFLKSNYNFPRAVEFNPLSELCLITDTYHNRIVVYDAISKREVRSINNTDFKQLYWPRVAIWFKNKIVIANSRKRSIICCSETADLIDEFYMPEGLFLGEWITSVDVLNENNYVISYESGWVIYDRKNEMILKRYTHTKDELNYNDIHSIKFDNKKGIIISDTGNNRIVIIDGEEEKVFSYILKNGNKEAFQKPRLARTNGKELWVVNSGNSEIVVLDIQDGRMLYRMGHERGFGINEFSLPRWFCFDNHGGIYIADTDNHRIAYRPRQWLLNNRLSVCFD